MARLRPGAQETKWLGWDESDSARRTMSEIHTVLSDKQKSAIRWLKDQRVRDANNLVARHTMAGATALADNDCDHLLHYLERRRAIEIIPADGAYVRAFYVRAGILELVRELDNPPPKDYWKDIRTWFQSRWWSVPVFVVAVGLPIVYTYFQMLKGLVDWLQKVWT